MGRIGAIHYATRAVARACVSFCAVLLGCCFPPCFFAGVLWLRKGAAPDTLHLFKRRHPAPHSSRIRVGEAQCFSWPHLRHVLCPSGLYWPAGVGSNSALF